MSIEIIHSNIGFMTLPSLSLTAGFHKTSLLDVPIANAQEKTSAHLTRHRTRAAIHPNSLDTWCSPREPFVRLVRLLSRKVSRFRQHFEGIKKIGG
jgi:hypothetical protein